MMRSNERVMRPGGAAYPSDRRTKLLVKVLDSGECLIVEWEADRLSRLRRKIRGEIALHDPARPFRRYHGRLIPQDAFEEVHRLRAHLPGVDVIDPLSRHGRHRILRSVL